MSHPLRRLLAGSSAAALLAAGLVLGTASAASAATIEVPTDHATIGAAVAAAVDGDNINVAAGTYTESVTVPVGKTLTITGAGSATTTITGTITLDSPSTVSGFAVEGKTTAVAPYTVDPFRISATGAGAIIENNVIRHGNRGVYIHEVVGTPTTHTVIRNNTFFENGYNNTGAVWISNSEYVDVLGNTLQNLNGGVGVNLVGGSSNIVIDSNSFDGFGNSLVLIANSSGFPTTPQSHDIAFTNNTITNSTSTALYIGGNNIIDVEITGNTITNIAGSTAAAIFITPGHSGDPDAWLEVNNRPLERFTIDDNDFDAMPYGIIVADGVQLANDTSVSIIENRFCTVDVAAIDNRDDERALYALDNDFCNGDVLGDVTVANTPASPGSGLADTGVSDEAWLAAVGASVAILGGFLLLRRRLVAGE